MDIYISIKNAVAEGDAEDVVMFVKKAIGLKYPPQKILHKGLIEGINVLAEKFREENVLVLEAILVTRAFHAGLEAIDPYLHKGNGSKGKVVIGMVEGDLHDVGKNIVKVLIGTLGLEIIDLGVDVSKREFIEVVKREKPDILMVSSLLTTTMIQMKYIIEELESKDLRKDLIIFVGGAPVTKEFSNEIGADYFISSAIDLMEFLRDNINKIIRKENSDKKKRIEIKN